MSAINRKKDQKMFSVRKSTIIMLFITLLIIPECILCGGDSTNTYHSLDKSRTRLFKRGNFIRNHYSNLIMLYNLQNLFYFLLGMTFDHSPSKIHYRDRYCSIEHRVGCYRKVGGRCRRLCSNA